MTNICNTITVRMDRKCAECGKGGATDSGICLRCATKAMDRKPLRSAVGRAVQKRMRAALDGSAGQGMFRRLGAVLDAGQEKS